MTPKFLLSINIKNVVPIIILLSVILSNSISSSYELKDNQIFAIQNAHDRTYLKALNNGEICDKRGDVITSRYLDQHSHAYRWMSKTMLTGRIHLEVDSHDFKINELTMQETIPNCYSAFAEYELAHVNENTFRIRNFHTKKCLTGNGLSQKISWETCQSVWKNVRNQFWNFIDLNKEKLYEEKK